MARVSRARRRQLGTKVRGVVAGLQDPVLPAHWVCVWQPLGLAASTLCPHRLPDRFAIKQHFITQPSNHYLMSVRQEAQGSWGFMCTACVQENLGIAASPCCFPCLQQAQLHAHLPPLSPRKCVSFCPPRHEKKHQACRLSSYLMHQSAAIFSFLLQAPVCEGPLSPTLRTVGLGCLMHSRLFWQTPRSWAN